MLARADDADLRCTDCRNARRHGVYLKADRILHDLLLRSDAVTQMLPRRRVLHYFVPLYIGMLGESRSARISALDAALYWLANESGVGAWP